MFSNRIPKILLVSSVRWATGRGTSDLTYQGAFTSPHSSFGGSSPGISHGREEASVLNYPGESGNWAELLPTRESCKRNTPMPGTRTKSDHGRCTVDANLLLFPSLSFAMDGVFWLKSAGEVPVPGCSGRIRALHDCRGKGTRNPLESHPNHSGSLTSHEAWKSSFLGNSLAIPTCTIIGQPSLIKFHETVCAEQDNLTSPVLLYWAVIRQDDQLHHWLGFETFPGGCQVMTSCSASLHCIKSMFTSDQKMDFLDLLIPEWGLVIVASQKIKADFPYRRRRTSWGLESSTSTRAGNLKGLNIDD